MNRGRSPAPIMKKRIPRDEEPEDLTKDMDNPSVIPAVEEVQLPKIGASTCIISFCQRAMVFYLFLFRVVVAHNLDGVSDLSRRFF